MSDFPLAAYPYYPYATGYAPVAGTTAVAPAPGYGQHPGYLTPAAGVQTGYVAAPSYQAQLAAAPYYADSAQLAEAARLVQALVPEDRGATVPMSAAAAGAPAAGTAMLPLAPLRANSAAAPLTTIRASAEAAAAAAAADIGAHPAEAGVAALGTEAPLSASVPLSSVPLSSVPLSSVPAPVTAAAVVQPVAAPAADAGAVAAAASLGMGAMGAVAGTMGAAAGLVAQPAVRVARGAKRRGSELWAGVRDPRSIHVTQVLSRYNPSPAPGNRDCGPASVLMALRMVGLGVPGLAAKAAPQKQIDRVRRLTGASMSSMSTTNFDLEKALGAAGAKVRELTDAGSIRAAVLAGRPVILNGNARNKGAYGARFKAAQLVPFNGAHWIVVSGLDQKTGEYIINDPLSKAGPLKVTPAMLEAYRNGSLGIEVSR